MEIDHAVSIVRFHCDDHNRLFNASHMLSTVADGEKYS